MLTKLFPMVQFKKNTWEIDEFDCASMFLLIGEEKALLIDCGMGIGDLRGAVEMLTDKPLIVAASHGHIDHTGNAVQFDELWINEKDMDAPIPQSLERRRWDTERIARRNKGAVGAPFTMFNLYPYDINTDLREPEATAKKPVLRALKDGHRFDLGGGRIVTAYECPGHTKGEMVFLDEITRTLICGDALNFNLGVGAVPVETTLKYLKRLRSMGDKYDGIYNGHHDFRAFGAPLDPDCLENTIAILEDAMAGIICPVEMPSFWGQSVPLTPDRAGETAPQMLPNVVQTKRVMLHRGRSFVSIDPGNIRE
ncbi:MAG: MBL fold metallo-hydrolase [Oscillospiraceae bacterium]